MDISNSLHESQQGHPEENNDKTRQSPLLESDTHNVHDSNDSRSALQHSSQHHQYEDDNEEEEDNAHHNLDPAWGIKQSDTVQLLGTVHRTSSFPRPQFDFSGPPAVSQPEQQMHNVEDVTEQTEHQSLDEPEPSFPDSYNPSGSSQQDVNIQHQDPVTQEESRFEEGMPLMSNDFVTEQETKDALADFKAIGHDDTIDDFDVRQTEPEVPVHSIPELERKDTQDVIQDLDFGANVPDSPLLSDDEDKHAPPVEKSGESALAAAFAEVPDAEDDPWKAAMGDDDEFLVEDADDLLPDSDEEDIGLPQMRDQSHPGGVASSHTLQRQMSNPYAPHQPNSSEFSQFGMNTTTNQVGLPRQPAPQTMSTFGQLPQAQITNRAESFVDQSKGGYKSPYDLPMDLAPKRKAHNPRVPSAVNTVPPPPRSSSLTTEKQLQSPFTPTAPVLNESAAYSPILQSAAPSNNRSASMPVKPAPTSNKRASGFFEELPIVAKPRPSNPSRATAQTPQGPPRSISMSKPAPVAGASQFSSPVPQQQVPSQQPSLSQFQLHAPEKIDPYSNIALQPVQPPSVQPVSSRYSPVPPAAQNGIRPSPSPRYSPAPPSQSNVTHNRYVSQPAASAPTLPFQPRTSSPLAQHRQSLDRAADQIQPPSASLYHSASSSVPYATTFSQNTAQTLSPPRAGDPVKKFEVVPPRRSQTQSPSRQMAKPGVPVRVTPAPNRPASAFGQLSPVRANAVPSVLSPPRVQSYTRVSDQVDYVRPTDETQHDPLERWKGAPIFTFGFGGSIVTSFPQRVPRFSSTASRPQMKVGPGLINVRTMPSLVDVQSASEKFPGPLKTKAKKKDLMSWLSTSIASLETTAMTMPSKQLEEKILLWKVMRTLIEQDGNLDNPQSVQTVSALLMPGVYGADDAISPQGPGESDPNGIYRPAATVARSEVVDPAAIENLRKMLLTGKREDAIWQAVDNRLWAHALLLSSTVDRKVWKQVVQEFVKQEVKTIGNNAESLCALYDILGGNLEESVDHLVPPSARAGLQMVSKAEASGPVRNALDGLDRWRETLCLVLNNRSTEDQRALITLARLLADYGRIEAAHICYLFARTAMPTLFGGLDDPAASVVLLGADHHRYPSTFNHDADSIVLTEVYEFAMSALAVGATGAQLPHLAVYKLQRANEMADNGMKAEAQAYCEAIASGLKSSTKHSLYYHPVLLGEVEDLSNRLKQVPLQGQSWIGKPSIEKVSGSVWNKFTSFVTGEDSDADSKGSVRDGAEAAPFANVTGSPALSRNSSQTDLYGSYPTATPVIAQTAAGSRYAPNGLHSARSSSEIPRVRPSLDSQRSPPSTSHSNDSRPSYAPIMQNQNQSQYPPMALPRAPQMPQVSPDPYMPPVVEESSHMGYTEGSVASSYPNAYQSPNYQADEPLAESTGVHNQHHDDESSSNFQTLGQPHPTYGISNEPVSSGFEPPESAYGGYQPPEDSGYVPYEPEPDSDKDDAKSKPKKKTIMDDDDDSNFTSFSRDKTSYSATASDNTTALSNDTGDDSRKKANDEAADAAFRAAAEADAKRASEEAANKKASGSWLGGWFSGGKKPDSLDAPSRPNSADKRVHRVHLGESKMKLYYDKEKGKWINPDNPEASEKKAVAPPPRSAAGTPSGALGGPPMAGPPRSVSSSQQRPELFNGGQLSRSGTPASNAVDEGSDAAGSRPGSSSLNIASTFSPSTTQSLGLSGPPPPGSSAGPPNAGPPSRPASALSSVSGLDDLLGPSTGPRKVSGRAAKGKKGRYVDVMAK